MVDFKNNKAFFFENSSASDDVGDRNASKIEYENENKDFYWLVCLIIGISVFIGNFTVALLIIKYKKNFNNYTTKIILSLSITDLLLSIFVVPFALYSQINRAEWHLGFVPCLLWLGSDMQLTTTSILHLCAISFERYLSVTKPILFRRRMSYRINCLITLSWLTSFFLCTVPFILFSTLSKGFAMRVVNNRHVCNYSSNGFLLYAITITFWLPLFFMTMFGLRTMYELHKKKKTKNKMMQSNSFMMVEQQQSGSEEPVRNDKRFSILTVYEYSKNVIFKSFQGKGTELDNYLEHNDNLSSSLARKASQKIPSSHKELQAQKTLLIVLIVFIICYFPLFTFLTINTVCNGRCKFLQLSGTNNDLLFNIFTWLGYSSSGINPWIYAYYNKNFKIGLQRLFKLRHEKLPKKISRDNSIS